MQFSPLIVVGMVEENFEGIVLDVDKRESEKGKTYYYLLIDEAGEEVSYGVWDKKLFPVLEKVKLDDQVKGTFKTSGDFRNIKSIEIVGGTQQTLAPKAEQAVLSIEELRLKCLNLATELVLKGMKPESKEYPSGLIKEIAKTYIKFIKTGE